MCHSRILSPSKASELPTLFPLRLPRAEMFALRRSDENEPERKILPARSASRVQHRLRVIYIFLLLVLSTRFHFFCLFASVYWIPKCDSSNKCYLVVLTCGNTQYLSLWINPSAAIVNDQLVCLPQLGLHVSRNLNSLFLMFKRLTP